MVLICISRYVTVQRQAIRRGAAVEDAVLHHAKIPDANESQVIGWQPVGDALAGSAANRIRVARTSPPPRHTSAFPHENRTFHIRLKLFRLDESCRLGTAAPSRPAASLANPATLSSAEKPSRSLAKPVLAMRGARRRSYLY